MSDFVTNLVGRSLSTLEVVRPRLPSLYEPHRRDAGPFLSARPGLGLRDGETGSERPPRENQAPLPPVIELLG